MNERLQAIWKNEEELLPKGFPLLRKKYKIVGQIRVRNQEKRGCPESQITIITPISCHALNNMLNTLYPSHHLVLPVMLRGRQWYGKHLTTSYGVGRKVPRLVL